MAGELGPSLRPATLNHLRLTQPLRITSVPLVRSPRASPAVSPSSVVMRSGGSSAAKLGASLEVKRTTKTLTGGGAPRESVRATSSWPT